MTTMTVSAMELRKSIGDILNRIQYTQERVIVERKGEPAAALVSVADLARLEQWEAARGGIVSAGQGCRHAAGDGTVHRASRPV
ncbi:MAG: type II toxin-antitoxin system Phd/YefM family antitoxin [Anaerolineae bacterium]|nr:MAG: type II toxin-antitoxin system Phd/YefM family antitoxin [Anaerolineae bacterium]